jgi:hypothetical protein
MHVLTDHTKRTHSSKIDKTFSHMFAHHTQELTKRTLSSRSIHSGSRSMQFFLKKEEFWRLSRACTCTCMHCMHVNMHTPRRTSRRGKKEAGIQENTKKCAPRRTHACAHKCTHACSYTYARALARAHTHRHADFD